MEATSKIARHFNVQIAGVYDMQAHHDAMHPPEVNHISNVTIFCFVNAASRTYTGAWVAQGCI